MSPASLNPRTRYVAENGWEIGIALLAVIAAYTFFTDPTAASRSAIGRALHPYDTIWSGMYGAAGVAMIVGILLLKPRVEIVGLQIFAAAVAINLGATLAVTGYAVPIAVGFQVIFLLLALLRIWYMFRVSTSLRRGGA